MKEMTFKISPDGSKIETDIQGTTGSACEEITKKVTQSIGALSDSKKKPEYFQSGGCGIHVGS